MISSSLILYHNKPEDVKNVLNSVLKSVINVLVVIDHSSNDELKKYITESDRVIYRHTPNDGYGAGHNLGFKIANEKIKSDYHIVVNPDVFFEPEAIANLSEYMDKHAEVSMVMPKVFYPNGDFQYLCKLLPTPSDIFLRQFAPEKIKNQNNRRYALMDADYEKEMEIPSLSGCFMFLRTACFEDIGGFDTRYFMHFEDIDLTRRMGNVGKTMYYPYSSIVHAHAAAHRQSKKMLLIGLKSAIKYFNKWGWFFDKVRRERNTKALNRYST